MSHWAELDENNIVKRVLVGDNNMPNEGYDWLIATLGGRWVQTSYNHNFRVRFASAGYSYDEERDAFIPPKPFPSWIFDEESCNWVAPVPEPTSGGTWYWNEDIKDWSEVVVVESKTRELKG